MENKYPFRFCHLYISDRFKQIIFVPFCKNENGWYAEINDLIIDSWPCNFEILQHNIETILDRYSSVSLNSKVKWPSFENSKAKSQQSFNSDYILFRLETDLSRNYGSGEVERIKVSATPTVLDENYSLVGVGHLFDTQVAQIVLDIFNACLKIRN